MFFLFQSSCHLLKSESIWKVWVKSDGHSRLSLWATSHTGLQKTCWGYKVWKQLTFLDHNKLKCCYLAFWVEITSPPLDRIVIRKKYYEVSRQRLVKHNSFLHLTVQRKVQNIKVILIVPQSVIQKHCLWLEYFIAQFPIYHRLIFTYVL